MGISESPQSRRQDPALVLEFDLDYGSDVTIAIRELVKQSAREWKTSSGNTATSDAALLVLNPVLELRKYDTRKVTVSRLRSGYWSTRPQPWQVIRRRFLTTELNSL
ncbi:hypothetical protein V7S43_013249 [Phytophthora oleae]|uniref:Uncharacterized protein n=1 Tax=Phytophthora oleae TaxID=2107226 RepID=A0ABD3F5G3_9STRA